MRRRLSVVGLLIGCVLAMVACSSGSLSLETTYRAEVEVPGPGTAGIEIQVSADGQSIVSLSLDYTETSSDFVNLEPYKFQSGEVPVVDGRFIYSRDVPEGDPRLLTAVSGQFISTTRAIGTIQMRLVGSEPGDPEGVVEYSWSAVAE